MNFEYSSLVTKRTQLNFGNTLVDVTGIPTKLLMPKQNYSIPLCYFLVNSLGTITRKMNAMTSSTDGK